MSYAEVVNNPLLSDSSVRRQSNKSADFGEYASFRPTSEGGKLCVTCDVDKKDIFISVVGIGMFVLILYILVTAVGSYEPANGGISYSAIVSTDTGLVQGIKYRANGSSYDIEAWRGIPFAEPPVGELRWKVPKRMNSPWDGVLETTRLKPACVQPDGSGSEDCLYLNIYRNANPSNLHDGPYPVLFYIYGGGLMSGQANNNFDSLIISDENQGLVVVEVAYRLNVFGFLALKELSVETGSSGNYGIMDQLLALGWVQRNIANFGGDPKRVTLAGQSSGGTSIMALLSAPSAKGLFAGAISMSGSPNISMPLKEAEAQNRHFVSAGDGGCAEAEDSASIMECMRALSVSDLTAAVPNSWNMPGIWNLPKSPSGQHYQGLVIVDGTLIPHDFPTSLSLGTVDVPFIFGNMQCESDEGPEMDVSAYSLGDWAVLLNSTFSNWPYPSVGTRVFDLYANSAAQNPQKAFDEIVSDYGLFCGQLAVARHALPRASGQYLSPIYIYEDRWGLSQPYISPWTNTTVAYPFHDTFFFMVTGQWNLVGDMGTYEPSERDLEGQRLLQSIWRYFMTHQSLEGSEFGWEPVNANPHWASESNRLPYGNYTVFVIDPSDSRSELNHKLDVCSYFHSIGLDQPQFWWAN